MKKKVHVNEHKVFMFLVEMYPESEILGSHSLTLATSDLNLRHTLMVSGSNPE